jgi:hypothetical protein
MQPGDGIDVDGDILPDDSFFVLSKCCCTPLSHAHLRSSSYALLSLLSLQRAPPALVWVSGFQVRFVLFSSGC